MIFTIDNVLTTEELNQILDTLDPAEFIDGKSTAGWHAKLVKNNTQLNSKAANTQDLQKRVKTAIQRHPLFQSAVQPRMIHSMLFSRYTNGMSYGTHVDNAFMDQQAFWRSDVSFTLFLSSPDSYVGGELVIEEPDDERTYKLEPGSMIVYPSSTLHRVETVTEGIRLAAVGWVQSLVRNPYDREILFDLDTARRSIFAKDGKSFEFDLISKAYANLLRKLAD